MTYLAILRRPGIFPLVVSTLLARLPAALNGIAVVFYVQANQDSFAVAGAVVSAMAIGNAIGGPLQGRLIDRVGVWPLLGFGFAHAAGLLAIIVVCGGGHPVAVQLAAGFLTGFALPVTTSLLRSRWSFILADRPDLLTPAYALDSVLMELAFVTGPLIAGLCLILGGAATALFLSAGFALVGTSAFTVLLTQQAGPRPSGDHARSLIGALSSPGLRLLTVISVPFGFYLGAVEISLPAFAHHIGEQAFAGVLLAVLAGASTVAALVYGVLKPRRPLWDLHLRFTVFVAVAAVPLLFATNVWIALPFVAIAGCPVAPVIATRNQLVRLVAPPGTEAEAFAWPLTAMIVGISIGAAFGGAAIGPLGWRAPVIGAAAVAAVAALPVMLLRVPGDLIEQIDPTLR